ncbi:MAG: aldehyde dehydrogenase family protein, partial [Betaproteobacteria bacterium]
MAQHFNGGRWVGARSGQTLPVLDPATGEPFDTIPRGTAADIDAAVRAARAARRGAWGRTT